MSIQQRTTLTQFLIEERRRFPHASGDFNALILDVALACKAIAKAVAFGELGGMYGNHAADEGGSVNVQGETQKKLDVLSNQLFIHMNEWAGHLAGMASEEMDDPYQIPKQFPRGKYLLVFDPLDGSSNIDVNVSVGSIFSILRGADKGKDVTEADFLQPGTQQVAAGYALYVDLDCGQWRERFHTRPYFGRVHVDTPQLESASTNTRVRDQCFEQPFLGSPCQALCGRVLGWQNRSSRQRLQHALDCVHGR